jgi:hypothetical protein
MTDTETCKNCSHDIVRIKMGLDFWTKEDRYLYLHVVEMKKSDGSEITVQNNRCSCGCASPQPMVED